MLELDYFSSNSSFIELQNFKFEHITSSSFFHFLSWSLSLKTIFISFGPNFSSISSFIEFEFALNTNQRARVWSSLSFWVLSSSMQHYKTILSGHEYKENAFVQRWRKKCFIKRVDLTYILIFFLKQQLK